MTAMTGDGGCSHGNSSPYAAPAQQGKSCGAGVSALQWALEEKSKTGSVKSFMGNDSPQKPEHSRANTGAWIICDVHGAHSSSEK